MAYKGGYRPAARLAFDDETYTPIGVKSLTDQAIKKEYSRLRSIARKRLERFEGTEWTDTSLYKEYQQGFKTLKNITDRKELNKELIKVSRFVTAQRSKVSGLEKERKLGLNTLLSRKDAEGKSIYGFVNKDNYRQYADFMEYSREVMIEHIYDSKQVADFYENALEKGEVDATELEDAFKDWYEHEVDLEKVQNRNQKGSKVYRQAMD